MIEKDYFLRALNTFFQKLSQYFNSGKDTEISEEMMRDFYTELFEKDRDFFVNSDFNASINAFNEKFTCEKAKALAEIFYVEMMTSTIDRKKFFATKSLEMFRYYEQNSNIFDLTAYNKINKLTQIIKNE